MHWGDIVSTATQGAQTAAQQSALSTTVSVRTNLNARQPVVVTPFAPGGPGGGPPNRLVELLQPEVVIGLPTGPVTIAPFGSPTRNDWPIVAAGLGMAAVAFMGLGALVRLPSIITSLAGIGAAYSAWHVSR